MSIPVIVVASHKGGVGKTKHCILIAESFSYLKGKKGLGIELDGQCNFSSRFVKIEIDPSIPKGKRPTKHPAYTEHDPEWAWRNSIANIYMGHPVDPYPTPLEKFEVTPAYTSKFLAIEAVPRKEQIEKIENRLDEFIQLPEVQEGYDYIVVDTGPNVGPLTVSALKAATHLLMPAEMEPYAVEGLYGMMQLWKQENLRRSRANKLKLLGIFPNKVANRVLHRDLLDGLKNNSGIGSFVAPHYLKDRIIYAERDADSASPRTIFDLPEDHIAKQEAIMVCDYIYNKVFSDE